ncbi:flagellar hook-associated protein FlgK [Caulobacter sp. BK020]|uniref:flagellar hook-associated protein FlgK n=1 Tax=Caulobacter sp. BK020 TaxID=2512117 RepID=UPI0010466424|nr:flagellar hook-associated protein FlgK [Caulobacter sp. BK020]TCS16660.1 flagellar hook-associated protein 1 FlgK [Caulobacter sp. BK020]
MSLNTILNVATSGMMAAQTGLRVTSDNVANINTAGYVRKTIAQSNLVSNGMGVGVNIDAIKRATDKFMAAASLNGASDAGRTGAIATAMDNAQKLFGDPSTTTNFFATLDDVYAAFSMAADDPSSTLLRSSAITKVEDFLGESKRITSSLSSQIKDTDNRIGADVDRVNDLLKQIDALNVDITRAKMAGADGTGSENVQSGLINELSTYMNIQVSDRSNGGVMVRSAEGVTLAGNGPATVTYNQSGAANGYLTVVTANSGGQVMPLTVSNGELQGLLELRNKELPNLSDQLGEFVSRAAEELNRASNAASSVPAPNSMTGKDTGLDANTAFANFTGKTTIAITNAAGAIVQRVDVDFSAGTMTVNGAAGPAFTNTNFLTQLNTALGGTATAAFANGQLSLNTATATNGIAIVDDATTPSTKAGKGFSQFFGLNDIVRSDGYSPYETGMVASDPSGFTPGQTISLRLTDSEGGRIRDIQVTIPTGTGTMQETIDALNSRNSGVGLYGAFTLGSKGELTFTSNTATPVNLSVVEDTTQRGVGGPSLSQLFGVGMSERSTRGGLFKVDPAMDANPSKLPFAKLDLTVAAGVPALATGDGRGALALAKAGDVTASFASAGDTAGSSKTVLSYGADFSGSIARKAAAATSRKEAADSVKTEVDAQRQSQEGVNLDEELVNLTTYQQAFNASARLIQATKDMFDVLTGIL